MSIANKQPPTASKPPVASNPVTSKTTTVKSKIQGALDGTPNNQAVGWAYNPNTPKKRVRVEIISNNRIVASGLADQLRPDLVKANIGDGHHRFLLNLSYELLDGNTHILSARDAETGVIFGSTEFKSNTKNDAIYLLSRDNGRNLLSSIIKKNLSEKTNDSDKIIELYNKASLFQETLQLEEAKKLWQTIQNTLGENEFLLYKLGEIHLLNGEFKKAEDAFKLAISKNKNFKYPYLNILNTYQKLNDDISYKKYLDIALTLFPNEQILLNKIKDKHASPANLKKESTSTPLETDFYTSWYTDLNHLNSEQAKKHWEIWGEKEGRAPNITQLIKNKQSKSKLFKEKDFDPELYILLNTKLIYSEKASEAQAYQHYLDNKEKNPITNIDELLKLHNKTQKDINDFDYQFYIDYYVDLSKKRINTEISAKIHYICYGHGENRYPSLASWAAKNKINKRLIPKNIEEIVSINKSDEIDATLKDLLGLINGEVNYPFKISHENHKNSKYYLTLAKYHLKNKNTEKAKKLLNGAIFYKKTNSSALELLGNTLLDNGDYNSAKQYYKESIISGNENKWIYFNYAKTLRETQKPESALETIITGATKYPNDPLLNLKLNKLTLNFIEVKKQEFQAAIDNNETDISTLQSSVIKKNSQIIKVENILFNVKKTISVPVFNESKLNYLHYYNLALGLKNNEEQLIKLLQAALSFEQQPNALEEIGNSYLRVQNYNHAYLYYLKSIARNTRSKWVYCNIAQACLNLNKYEDAISYLIEGIKNNPDFTFLHTKLDESVNKYWLSKQAELNLLAQQQNRDALIGTCSTITNTIYNAYLKSFGADKNPDKVNTSNTDKILIIGDYHIPQCIRYRIDQKVEQLKSQGKKVTTISWLDIKNKYNTISTHDIVIFYRVPSLPEVIKSIASVNATGKISFYEIDDLIFDSTYPPELTSYGGYVGLDTYTELTKGMALFNSAAKLCRYGISSTNSLAKELKNITFGKDCLLHRNGLDKNNELILNSLDKEDKKTIDIFYGSGTKAHNSDFIELILPALQKILTEQKNVRLIITGYLILPREFLSNYQDQLKILPAVDNIKAYYGLLSNADINIAVLYDDKVSGAKSELKWFEAACYGIPSVLSSTSNYRDVINGGIDGILASSTDEWYSALTDLIKNKEKRKKIGHAAFSRVAKEYSVTALGKKLVEQLDTVVSTSLVTKEKRKKIALVNVFFPPQSIGGATRVVADNFDILNEKYANDFELCVFTSDADCKDPHQLSVYNYKGVKVYRSTVLFREYMDWHPQDNKMYDLFSQFLLTEKPDLVHFHCIQRLTGSIVEATKDLNIPYVITVHDAWWISDYQFLVDDSGTIYQDGHPDIYNPRTLPKNISLSKSIERLLYLKSLINNSKAALIVSEKFSDIYKKNGIRPLIVNKNGISENVIGKRDTSHSAKVVCAHIGGMAEHKGYFLFKKAIEMAQPENIEVLVVDHSKDEGYQETTEWKNPNSSNKNTGVKVTYIGRISQSNVSNLYSMIDVLFAPSLWPESFGLVTREANASGCWVVTSNRGGIGEDIIENENGHVVEPELSEIKEVISKINKNPSKYKETSTINSSRTSEQQVYELSEIYKNF